jgi:hypothetical protein
MKYTYPIVGMFYRPPAQAILSVLSPGTELIVRAEPTNAVDPNAIAVWISTADIPDSDAAHKKLELGAAECGLTLDDVLSTEEHHLGYIPAAIAAALKLDDSDRPGELVFSTTGRYFVTFDLD